VCFIEGSAAAIPLPDHCVDVVTSFETLEHLTEQEEMINEIHRVLHPDGLLIISTPNTAIYDPVGHQNPFHLRELGLKEFYSLLKSRFTHVELLGQKFVCGSLMIGQGEPFSLIRAKGQSQSEQSPCFDQSMYFVALATNGKKIEVTSSFFEYDVKQTDFVRYIINMNQKLTNTNHTLDQDCISMQQNIDSLLYEKSKLEQNIGILRELYTDMEKKYNKVVHSSSWRMTRPLRHLTRHIREMGRSLRRRLRKTQ